MASERVRWSAAPGGGVLFADTVSDQLAAVAAILRDQGARVGLGELLTAHRALAAVDCTSREDARLALRAVLCSERGDLAKFERAFYAVFGERVSPWTAIRSTSSRGCLVRCCPMPGIPTTAPPPPDRATRGDPGTRGLERRRAFAA